MKKSELTMPKSGIPNYATTAMLEYDQWMIVNVYLGFGQLKIFPNNSRCGCKSWKWGGNATQKLQHTQQCERAAQDLQSDSTGHEVS